MTQINFSKTHMEQLQNLSLQFLFAGNTVKGTMGTSFNIHQLLHDTTIKSLQGMYLSTSKEIENQSKLDRWSMTEYQQKKLEDLKQQAELLDLLIGYKKSEALKESTRAKINEKKELLATLKDQTQTPEDRIKKLELEISELEA